MRQSRTYRNRKLIAVSLVVATLALGSMGVALAAEMASGDVYRLDAGQTIEDDLYVTAGEVYIDGKVEGDLIVAGGYIEINGEVTSDLIAAGGGIVVNGKVGDDARIAGGGIDINGSIGDDLMAAGGGTAPGAPPMPFRAGNHQIQQGVRVSSDAQVGGDAYLVGGMGVMEGTVSGDLYMAMGEATLDGDVAGDARLYGNTIVVSPEATVGGTLTYSTDQTAAIPEGVAASVQQVAPPAEVRAPEPTITDKAISWGIGYARALIGLLLLGWLLLKLTPSFMNNTLSAMSARSWASLGIGFIVFLVAVPVITLLVGLAVLFWDFFPGGLATAFLLYGLLGVIWFTSPALTGLCLGQLLLKNSGRVLQLFAGTLIILLLARGAEWIPGFGWFVSWLVLLVSFMYAAGAIILGLRTPPTDTCARASTYARDGAGACRDGNGRAGTALSAQWRFRIRSIRATSSRCAKPTLVVGTHGPSYASARTSASSAAPAAGVCC